ncbi:MAG: riboflavin synthase [Desulfobacterales bacterium]
MFTGIIEGLGLVGRVMQSENRIRLTIESEFKLEGTKIGDSIAVNGACLTIVGLGSKQFEADVSPETLARTTFSRIRTGERVNLERALRLSDRLDGHIVSGHIDGVGVMEGKHAVGSATIVHFTSPPELNRYMIEKGSVAVDGISLTINTCDDKGFSVTIIPHTAGVTTVGFKNAGDRVNIETDMIGKYVERFLAKQDRAKAAQTPTLDREFLAKAGFI